MKRSCFALKQFVRSIIESHSEQVRATVITRTMISKFWFLANFVGWMPMPTKTLWI